MQSSALSISFILPSAFPSLPRDRFTSYLATFCSLYLLPSSFCLNLLRALLLTLHPPALSISLPCYLLLSTPSYSVTSYSLLHCYLLLSPPTCSATSWSLYPLTLLSSALSCSLYLLTLLTLALSTFLPCDLLPSLPPYLATFWYIYIFTLESLALSNPFLQFPALPLTYLKASRSLPLYFATCLSLPHYFAYFWFLHLLTLKPPASLT